MKKILIIDTKAGNLFSLTAAIKRLGYKVTVLEQPPTEKYDGIVIPGQGRFGTVLENFRAAKWDEFLIRARKKKLPILGICVGMQIFFESSDEDPEVEGLRWFSGKVSALNFPKKPMVGWCQLKTKTWNEPTVYFVNSFAVKESAASIATASYGETFCAAVRKGSFTGVQFHPEKSSKIGLQIISESLNIEEDKNG